MKTLIKLLIPVMCFALLSGCTDFDQDNSFVEKETCTNTNSAITRILDFANMEAEHFFPSASRSDMRVANPSDLKFITSNLSRSEEQDTLIYVVNFADNRGFALISAKDRQNPLLAIVPEGSYDPEIGTDNPGFNMFIADAKLDAARIGKLDPIWGDDPSTPYIENGKYVRYRKSTLEEIKTEPRLGTDFRWNQFGIKGAENIYGRFCPNNSAGCAPVAMGSVIAFYNAMNSKTTNINYTFEERQRDAETINWTDIFSHKAAMEIYHDKTLHWDDCSCSPSNHNTIAHFLRQLGQDAKTTYKPDSTSSTLVSRLTPTLKKYLDDCTVSGLQYFKDTDLKTALKEGVAILSGKRNDDSHAWVIDGLSYKRILEERYESDITLSTNPSNPTYDWKLISSEIKETFLCYTHWGWGGDFDGWFSNTYYEPEKTPGDVGTPYTVTRCVTIK